MTLRIVPDPLGPELRAVESTLRRLQRFDYLRPDPRRDRAVYTVFATRAPWDALALAAYASRDAARVLNIARSARTDDSSASAAYHAGELLADTLALTAAAERALAR